MRASIIVIRRPDERPTASVYDDPAEARASFKGLRLQTGNAELWDSGRGRVKRKKAETTAPEQEKPKRKK